MEAVLTCVSRLLLVAPVDVQMILQGQAVWKGRAEIKDSKNQNQVSCDVTCQLYIIVTPHSFCCEVAKLKDKEYCCFSDFLKL